MKGGPHYAVGAGSCATTWYPAPTISFALFACFAVSIFPRLHDLRTACNFRLASYNGEVVSYYPVSL